MGRRKNLSGMIVLGNPSWSNPTGENLDLAFGAIIVDVATFLKTLFLETGLTDGARAHDTSSDSFYQILGAPVSCEHGFYGRHG
jgi:hypothetical protein